MNDPEQPRCRLEEESGVANKANKEEQQRAPIVSVLEKRETKDQSARMMMMMMMMIPNKRVSAFMLVIENRGSRRRPMTQNKNSLMGQLVTIPQPPLTPWAQTQAIGGARDAA